MAPIIAALLKGGLTVLGNAVLAKGRDAIEEKIGVKLPELTVGQDLPPEQLAALRQAEFAHEQWLIEAGMRQETAALEAIAAEDRNITDRWQADLAAPGVWLSANVRPIVLLYLLSAYTILALMSAFDLNVEEVYVTLLGQWGMLVMTAYFGGKSIENIYKIRKGRAIDDGA